MFKARGDSRMKAAEMLVANFDSNPLKKFWLHESSITKKKEMKKKINFFTSIP